MLTVGVDAHKRTNMAVARDAAGREVARWRGPNSAEGWQRLAAWAAARDADARWGIEGAWNYGRGLAQHLVEAGATVHEVNARWTAAGRRRARTMAKRGGLDARAVALVVWREAAALPAVILIRINGPPTLRPKAASVRRTVTDGSDSPTSTRVSPGVPCSRR